MGLRLGFYALIAIVGFVTAGLGLISQGSQGQRTGQASAIAAPLASDNGNGNGNGNGNDNDDEDNDNNDNDEDNQNEGGGGGGGGAQVAAAPSPPQNCALAGHDTSIATPDGRITVHVFPTMSRNLRITIVNPVDPSAVPAAPGQRVDALVFQILADDCGEGTAGAISPGAGLLPAEVNLGVRYSDADVGGLNEANFKIAWLNPANNTWTPLAKQAPDPGANYVSATINSGGYFVVYQ